MNHEPDIPLVLKPDETPLDESQRLKKKVRKDDGDDSEMTTAPEESTSTQPATSEMTTAVRGRWLDGRRRRCRRPDDGAAIFQGEVDGRSAVSNPRRGAP